jgi:hypothetical protein
MNKKDCKHTSLVFTTKTTKLIPEGWEEFNNKEDVDLEDYETVQEAHTVFCEDCGEYLEEGY